MSTEKYEHSMEAVTRGGRTPEECQSRAYWHGVNAARSGKYRIPPFTSNVEDTPLVGAWLRGYDDGERSEDEYFICYPNMSRAGLYRVLYAVIMVGGAVTQTFTLADRKWTPDMHARCTVDLMVRIPKGTRERFAELAQCEMSEPPTVGVN
jgi:hypothetical protein